MPIIRTGAVAGRTGSNDSVMAELAAGVLGFDRRYPQALNQVTMVAHDNSRAQERMEELLGLS